MERKVTQNSVVDLGEGLPPFLFLVKTEEEITEGITAGRPSKTRQNCPAEVERIAVYLR